MRKIEQFPYGNVRSDSHPLHNKVLLLKMNSLQDDDFAVGYYDAVRDVFQICMAPFICTADYRNREFPVGGEFDGFYCSMPNEFTNAYGPRTISEYLLMPEALIAMKDRNLFCYDIDRVLRSAESGVPYLVRTKDNRIMVLKTGDYAQGILPVGEIYSVVNLMEFRGGNNE